MIKLKHIAFAGIVAAAVVPALAYAGKRFSKARSKPRAAAKKVGAKIVTTQANASPLKKSAKNRRSGSNHGGHPIHAK